jgi:repressor LexA
MIQASKVNLWDAQNTDWKKEVSMGQGKISPKQKEILEYIKSQILERGFPPAVRDICEAVHLKSTSSVHSHLETLEKNGYIRRDPTKPRAIEILDDSFNFMRREMVNVPIIGRVAAGEPILAEQNIENYFPIPMEYMPNSQTFILKVKGESMINAGILDGDFVLVEQRATARNGEMVVALIEDGATVKTFYKEDGYIRLQPENDTMDPIIVTDLQILGKVIGIFRFFD